MNVEIEQLKQKLIEHPIYSSIDTMEKLRFFMSIHVFAVWDFMSIAKRLQHELTSMSIPWLPPKNPSSAKLINEIIYYEETDLDHHGKPASHLDIYLEAMGELSADTTLFETFLNALYEGKTIADALDIANPPTYIKNFVSHTIHTATQRTVEEVASSFLYGRENAIPLMFSQLLAQWGIDQAKAPGMTYYLKRHIDLDGDEHGPTAEKILRDMIGDDGSAHGRAEASAKEAIQQRIQLWDGIEKEIKTLAQKKHRAQAVQRGGDLHFS